jgi:hypothetical protein
MLEDSKEDDHLAGAIPEMSRSKCVMESFFKNDVEIGTIALWELEVGFIT